MHTLCPYVTILSGGNEIMNNEIQNLEATEQRASEIAEETGCELMHVIMSEAPKNDCFEDDGFLHIQIGYNQICFDVGYNQTLNSAQQNENTKMILSAYGLTVTSRVLA